MGFDSHDDRAIEQRLSKSCLVVLPSCEKEHRRRSHPGIEIHRQRHQKSEKKYQCPYKMELGPTKHKNGVEPHTCDEDLMYTPYPIVRLW